jgi:hypothetical protein
MPAGQVGTLMRQDRIQLMVVEAPERARAEDDAPTARQAVDSRAVILKQEHAWCRARPPDQGKRLVMTDPAALQRAAAAYTEMFCAVASLKASVATLQPVAAGVPAQGLLDL